MGGKFPTTGSIYVKIDRIGGKSFTFRTSAYGCMLVASGKAIAYIGGNVKPRDAVAAGIILREAGAKVTDFSGQIFSYGNVTNGIIATNGLVHDELLTLLGNLFSTILSKALP